MILVRNGNLPVSHTSKFKSCLVLSFSEIVYYVLVRISAWNIIALRDSVSFVWLLLLSNEGALVAQINDLHFLKQRIRTKTLTEVTIACWLCEYRTGYVLVRVQNYKCQNAHPHPPARQIAQTLNFITLVGKQYFSKKCQNIIRTNWGTLSVDSR